jgi:DNA-binding NarL/FixJ family response regulator
MARLVLVDDHVLVRQSIRGFLEESNFQVVGEASTGTEALNLVNSVQPDLVLLDIHLPEMSGIEVARRIKQDQPDTRIVALTAYNEAAYQRTLMGIGADGYVLKTAEFKELLQVIQGVLADQAKENGTRQSSPTSEDRNSLTEREREVLICAGRGWTNKQIGSHLHISDRTVQVHLQAIYQKLQVNNRTEAVLRAIVLGLINSIDGATE